MRDGVAALYVQGSSLHFPGPADVTNTMPITGDNVWHDGFEENLEELLQDTYGTFMCSEWALGMYFVHC